jgi:hypothetical protein
MVDELKLVPAMAGVPLRQKEITKEGLSEYFLYTIEGTETIPNTWSKRLPSFDTDDIPVVNLYKFEEDRYGPQVIRYLSFTNDEDHELGETPIPGGQLRVYRTVDDARHLSYEGQSGFKYIPVGEEIELNLGPVSDIIVEPTLMDVQTDNYRFDNDGNVNGWDNIQTFELTIKNTRPLPVKIEIKRNFATHRWTLKNLGGSEKDYEKVDLDTVKYTLNLQPESEQTIAYELTTYQGSRAEDWDRMQQD